MQSYDKYFRSLDRNNTLKSQLKSVFNHLSLVTSYLLSKNITTKGFVDVLYQEYLRAKIDVAAYGQGQDREAIAKFKINNVLKADQTLELSGESIYLDVASGDGTLANEFRSKFELTDYYMSDIKNLLAPGIRNNVGERFIEFQDDQPIPLSNVGVMSAFQMLHHVKNVDFRIENFSTMLRDGGHFVISEHDVSDENLRCLILLEHIGFEIAEIPRDMHQSEFRNWFYEYDLNLMSFAVLDAKLKKAGLQLIGKTEPSRKNATYYAVYQKMVNI